MPRKRPVEYSILYTATLCLLAGGAVMVYSASSAESLLSGPGDASYYLKRYVMFALVGMVLLHLASRHGLKLIRALKPLLLVVGAACALLMKQPDMGTTMVICFSIGALLVAAGTPIRHLVLIGGVLVFLATVLAIAEPYRRERLFSFLDPFADAGDSGFQAVQALTAIGSGGFFGVGLGESVQKIFYLPEAHTDMILGIIGLIGLYGMIGYAGLRVAKLARDRYSKLLAAGITSLILCQATLNFFAVLGLMPLTGVPLPFISYGASNLVVLMGAMGLLLNVAATGGRAKRAERPELRAIDGGGREDDRDRRGRDRGARRAGARRS